MYTGLQHLHSYLAYLVLAGLLVSIIYALMGYSSKRSFTDRDRKMGLLCLVPAHIQLLAGILLYFVSPLGLPNAGGDAMKDSVSRLYFLEHPLMMVIALVLITVGYSRSKRLTNDQTRFKSIWLFYGLGLILILLRLPWNAWPGN